MPVFREYDSGVRDRTAEDRRRHRQLVEEAIKKNLHEIVAEESIIGRSKNKKIKIPIRGLKEYQFIFGRNQGGVWTGTGKEKRGDLIAREVIARGGPGRGGPGAEEGEEIYETEITLEDLVNYIFDDLNLPRLERKKLSRAETEVEAKRLGYRTKGIPPRLAIKRSVIEKLKRRQGRRRVDPGFQEGERFPFHQEDLRYHHVRKERRPQANAVVFCIMDTSGSMHLTKKYLARSFYFLLYQYLRLRYTRVEVVFIAHTTTAREVNEEEFFRRVESGGTFISSGYRKALAIIEERFNPAVWNIYAFHTSDGENWEEDNERAVAAAAGLCKVCTLFGYGEIDPDGFPTVSPISKLFQQSLPYDNFTMVKITGKEDVFPALKKLLILEESWT